MCVCVCVCVCVVVLSLGNPACMSYLQYISIWTSHIQVLCFSGTGDWWLPCKALDLVHSVPSAGIAPPWSHAHFTHSCLRSLGCFPSDAMSWCSIQVGESYLQGHVTLTGASPAGPHQPTPPLQGLFHALHREGAEEMCAEMKWQYVYMFPEFGLGWLLLSERKVKAVAGWGGGSGQGSVSQKFPRLSFFSLVSCLFSP